MMTRSCKPGVVLAIALGVLLLGVPTAGAFTRHTLLEFPEVERPGHPTGVAVDQVSGNVYVVDSSFRNMVDVFGAEGGAPAGGGPTQITGGFRFENEPTGVAVDNACYLHEPRLSGAECESFDPSNGDVYVASPETNTIYKLRLNPITHEYDAQALAAGGIPYGVAVDPNGNVYVAAFFENGIREFDTKGEEIGKIEQHTVAHPGFIAADGTGDLYVGDYLRGGVVVKLKVNASTEVLSETVLAHEGATAVGLEQSTGDVFLDNGSHVSEYNSSGTLIGEFAAGALSGSTGIAVNEAEKHVYASDNSNQTVVEFGPQIATPLVATGEAVVSKTTATVTGTVNPEAAEAGWWFEYAAAGPEGCTEFHKTPEGHVRSASPVQAPLVGLNPGTGYCYRIVAENENAASYGAYKTFTTLLAPPALRTNPAQGVTHTTAVLTGEVDPEGLPLSKEPNKGTVYWFQYSSTGANEEYGQTAPAYPGLEACPGFGGCSSATLLAPILPVTVQNLAPGTAYRYRIVAENEDGISYGEEQTFTTEGYPPPTVTIAPASGVTATTAMLAGTVESQGVSTTYAFQYGTTTAYGSEAFGEAGSSTGAVPVTLGLEGLLPGTIYHYRLLAKSIGGVEMSGDGTFTTPSLPVVIAQPIAPPLLPTPSIAFPTGTGPSLTVSITNTALRGGRLLVTVETSLTGAVTIGGSGLKTTTVRGLAAGSHLLKVALTKTGRRLARAHRKTSVRATLTVGTRSASETLTAKL